MTRQIPWLRVLVQGARPSGSSYCSGPDTGRPAPGVRRTCDHVNDPMEHNNLARDPASRSILDSIRTEFEQVRSRARR